MANGDWNPKIERSQEVYTRPQPSAEPVAWQRRYMWTLASDPPGKIYQWEQCSYREATNCFERDLSYEYRPLYPASALEAACREALEWAAKRVEQFERPRMDEGDYLFIREAATAIRALKENPNAG